MNGKITLKINKLRLLLFIFTDVPHKARYLPINTEYDRFWGAFNPYLPPKSLNNGAF